MPCCINSASLEQNIRKKMWIGCTFLKKSLVEHSSSGILRRGKALNPLKMVRIQKLFTLSAAAVIRLLLPGSSSCSTTPFPPNQEYSLITNALLSLRDDEYC
jgi:hypothetical protein